MLITNGNKTIDMPEGKKLTAYLAAGWKEVETKVETKVEPKEAPVEEPTETEENEDGSD